MEIYKDKQRGYYTNVRYDLLKLIPGNPDNRILELGAGGGDTLVTIKSNGLAREVIGIELNELKGSNQHHPAIDRFIYGNIESMKLDIPENYFDVVLIGDVLEHLIDPWKTVEKLRQYLKKGGRMIVSIPNIRHYQAIIQIFFKGAFSYSEFGLFDKTHLRFFCKKDMVKILSSPELKVESITSILDHLPPSKIKTLNNITFKLFDEFLSLQYLIVARKI